MDLIGTVHSQFLDKAHGKMNIIVNQKVFQPITIFTVSVVCLNTLKESKIFTAIVLLLAFISAILMAKNIFKYRERRKINFVIELVYVLIIYSTIIYMPTYVRIFYSVTIVVIEYSLYVLWINPVIMNRKLVFKVE